ncbi:DUF3383 family protein [Sporosarcina sp. FSL W7-1283]|uniref:DUF3383 family protein n=1 Tax=Sporosarcina sp. FSL W7-1283 TaxID=2921560 RepID=UPI0030F777A4
MTNVKDVEVIITRETAALTQQGFGLPFILATNGEKEYSEYTGIEQVAKDYPVDTAAYKIAARIFGQTPRPPMIAMAGIAYAESNPETLVTFLNELIETKNDWYYLECDQNGDNEITALSKWIDTQKKLYGVTTQNIDLLKEIESDRTFLFYHDDPESYVAEGLIARCAPEEPGSITWKFKTVNGVKAANIGISDITQLHTDNGNTYLRKFGILQTSEGKVTSGEYIYVMQSQDFLDARLTEEVSRVFFTQKKVAYENSGIALIVSAATAVLKRATEQGIVLKDDAGNGLWEIQARSRENSLPNDVANRVYDGLVILVPLAGAIHGTTLRLTMTYNEGGAAA